MPSFQDSAVLILLALLLFGPKGLAKLARQLGRLMGEFRRASNEFRMQMEEEFRLEEQAEQQKKIDAMKAAAPVSPLFPTEPSTLPEPEHPHIASASAEVANADHVPPPAPLQTDYSMAAAEPLVEHHIDGRPDTVAPASAPLPIASSGELNMLPPATGLPIARSSSVADAFDAIPHAPADSDQHEPVHG